MLGETIGGRYRIIEQIGKGGFGVTFLAKDMQRPGHPQCVVKQLKPMANDPTTLRAGQIFFEREAQTLETLGNHDCIPRLLAHFEENQQFFVVQEFIEGHDLNSEIFSGKKLSENLVIKIIADILEVLAFVHQQGVIHRDIKPSNIRRRKSDGKLVLIDFGAVKQISTQVVNSQGKTNLTVTIGTCGYMPSEQAHGNPHFSSDIYAVGIIAIQGLTGLNPDQLAKENSEIVWRNQADVSPEFADFLDKMVRYDFRQRYQDGLEAWQAISHFTVPETKKYNTLRNEIASQPTASNNPTLPPPSVIPKHLLIAGGITALFATAFLALLPLKNNPKLILSSEYKSKAHGIKIKYAQNWERRDKDNAITEEIVAFISPKESNKDKLQERLVIRIENLASPVTLEEYSKTFVKEISTSYPQAKIGKPNLTILANKRGYKIISTLVAGNNRLQNMYVFTVKGDKAYVITYMAENNSYNKFIDAANKMIKSFEIQTQNLE
ncbi:MAG: protein kinase [Nostocaceae cyanobacterium]|nr:protein kinase [Nostocaceae cyanobacterium]